MALLKDTFVTDEAEDLSFEPIPAGNYIAQIIESDLRVTKAGNGEYIALTWEILGDEYAGRRIFSNLNIVNPNEKAVQIAKSFLKQICTAIGLESVQDTQELHGAPMAVTVKIQAGSRGYADQNVINSVKSLSESEEEEPWQS